MKKILLLLTLIPYTLFLLPFPSAAQTSGWLWAKSAGGANMDKATSIATDFSGNVYMVGIFDSPRITFGTTTLSNADSTGNTDDMFLVKYNSSGNIQWAKSAGGTGWDDANSVAVDTSGNVYVAGYFSSPVITFGATTLTNAGENDIFLVKYDAAGNVLWAKSEGGNHNDEAYSIATDVSGNIYISGMFDSNSLVFGSDTLTNAGNYDIFLAKFNTSGNVIWAKRAGGIYNDGEAFVAVDSSTGNIYLAGNFYSPSIVFGTTTLINADNTGNTSDIFLAKYGTNGNVLWAKRAGGTSYDVVNSISTNASGNIFLAGYFDSPFLAFDTTNLTNAGYDDIFLAKYNANGNVQWAKSAGGTDDDEATSVATDASGNAYLTGYYLSATINFSFVILTNAGYSDLFVTKYNAAGNVLWAIKAGGTIDDRANSVAIDVSGNIYVSGWFDSPSLTFGSTTLTNAGYDDVIIAEISSITGINELGNKSIFSVFPNPTTDNINIIIPKTDCNSTVNTTIIIQNTKGQIINSINTDKNLTNIDISGIAKGIYFITVKTENNIAVEKFVIE